MSPRSRISRRVIAEQHLQLCQAAGGYVGIIASQLAVREVVELAGQRAAQARQPCAFQNHLRFATISIVTYTALFAQLFSRDLQPR